MKNIGIYIHIPFCKQKCYYCDFISYSKKDNLIEEYINAILEEIKDVAKGNKDDYENRKDDLFLVKTIYIGGGTPSYINSKYIVKIVKLIKDEFKIAEDIEITLEVNPGTVNKEKLKDYYEIGINRLSIGLQSTNDELLKLIGRIHTYSEFEDAYNWARKVGFNNINADLIIGLPKQKIDDVEKSVKRLIELGLEHISVYSLILEEGTVLEKKVENKELELVSDDEERNMYWCAKKMLEENGYKHYEISNFAKNGYESKHNMDCWNQKEYIGFGVAAHSYTNNIRYSNIECVENYISNIKENRLEKILYSMKSKLKV